MNKQHLLLSVLSAVAATDATARCPFQEMKDLAEAHHQMIAEFDQRAARFQRLFAGFMDENEQCAPQDDLVQEKATKLACPTTQIREEKEHIVVSCDLGESLSASKDVQATIDEEGIEVTMPSLGKTAHLSTDKWDGVTFLTVKVKEENNQQSDERQQKFVSRSRQRMMVAGSLDLENPAIDVKKGILTISVPKKMSKKVNVVINQIQQDEK